MDAFYGEIRAFGFSFAPQNWAYCNGAVVNAQQFNVLYAVIGNLYGGSAPNTFALPNLQGRGAIGTGTGPGLTPRPVAQQSGAETVTLTSTNQLPAHTHALNAFGTPNESQMSNAPSATVGLSRFRVAGTTSVAENFSNTATQPTTTLSPNALSPVGGAPASAHENRQPYLAMNFCICVQEGIFPVRP